MKNIYCISGLGADHRAFSKLAIKGYRVNCIPWLTPLAKETLSSYAKRMTETIEDENPVLAGVSFGGMMGIEISKQIKLEKLIIISSVKTAKELPVWMRTAGFLQLNKIFPMRSFKITEPLQNRNLGISTPEEIELVRSYRRNAPQAYMDWAINQVLNWRNDWQPTSIFHVHGDADKLFPISRVAATHVIKGGGHFMVMNRAAEVSAALEQILTS